jgi:hypothetical protein
MFKFDDTKKLVKQLLASEDENGEKHVALQIIDMCKTILSLIRFRFKIIVDFSETTM